MFLSIEERVEVLEKLGERLQNFDKEFETVCQKAFQKNNWFTPDNIKFAAKVWGETLKRKNLVQWISSYTDLIPSSPISLGEGPEVSPVAVINPGNIPFAGLHDLLSVFITGNNYIAKNSSDDPYLMSYIVDLLVSIDAGLNNHFQFVDRLPTVNSNSNLQTSNSKPLATVIATGSNNSSHYFEYYFRDYPHIIRRNRNAVAVLTGKETKEDLKNLGEDIFRYFGLGCRNVSKLYVPQGYDFKTFFEAMESFSSVMQHNKYMNNFEYNSVMLLMKKVPFLQNGFLIVRNEKQIPSPIAVIHYEEYNSKEALSKNLDNVQEQIQCVVNNEELIFKTSLHDRVVNFGQAQYPTLLDYADGMDTVKFLLERRISVNQ